MTLDEVLASLFPSGHKVERGPSGTLHGTAKVDGQGEVTLVGVVDGTPLGVDGAILLAGQVLAAVEAGGQAPIVVLVDTASQKMARRDELLGLNEFLAHLAKSLALAATYGHRTVSVLFGGAAAGAFIATALSSQYLVALPGAEPSVMDLSVHLSSHQTAAQAAYGTGEVNAHLCTRRRAAIRDRRGDGGLDRERAARTPSGSPPAAACGHFGPPRPDRARTRGAPLGPKDRRAGRR